MKECPNCKEMVDENLKYCYNCGTSMSSSQQEPDELQKKNKQKRNIAIAYALFLVIVIIILFLVYGSDNTESTNENINMSAEEIILGKVNEVINKSTQTIDGLEKNENTGKYDLTIREERLDPSDNTVAYICAENTQYLANQIKHLSGIGSVQFECINNDRTIYYIKVDNVSIINPTIINNYTKYYDKNHNEINTNIDILKVASMNDYKNSCSTYNYKDVLRTPSEYAGKRAYWFGKIVQVVSKETFYAVFRINVTCETMYFSNDYFCDDTIYVIYTGTDNFIEDDMVKLWGEMNGTETYTTVLGANVTIPKFNAKYIELYK